MYIILPLSKDTINVGRYHLDTFRPNAPLLDADCQKACDSTDKLIP